jgi:hypothetical protein
MANTERILQRINELLEILRIVLRDVAEISKTLKSIVFEQKVETLERLKTVDKERLFRVILWSFRKYDVSGLRKLAYQLNDPKAIHLAEAKKWNELMDYLYEGKYSQLISLYNKAMESPKLHAEAYRFAMEEKEVKLEGIFECPYCGSTFWSEEELQEHELIHV